MRVSARTEYALQAVAQITAAGDTPVTAREICRALDAPYGFVTEALHAIRRAGYVHAVRGPGGGYRLAVSPDDLSVADIVWAVEPESLTVDPERRCAAGCADAITTLWTATAHQVQDVLSGITATDLANGDLPPWVQIMAGDLEPTSPTGG